jgi:hypothetical protein
MTGEKLSEHQVVTSVKETVAQLGLKVDHFTLAPVFGDPPHYELLVESELDESMGNRLTTELDQRLAQANCEYENRLETARLKPIVLRQLPPGTWDRFHQRALGRQGASVEQFKHPCLTSDYQFIERLLSPAEQESTVSR